MIGRGRFARRLRGLSVGRRSEPVTVRVYVNQTNRPREGGHYDPSTDLLRHVCTFTESRRHSDGGDAELLEHVAQLLNTTRISVLGVLDERGPLFRLRAGRCLQPGDVLTLDDRAYARDPQLGWRRLARLGAIRHTTTLLPAPDEPRPHGPTTFPNRISE